ncbi:MarR family transcriptional regulator [Hylemonella gracilis]|jgi:DNA-binding MarR family transcriptional regulator|uniref:MarR family transcriptional regulator n=1 Tax=Hylemonella gracilis TaxID=80880 RepID=A0A4P6UL84_9BURK|nr:MarR family winged helix-turn-helix transcriptional regulator [Hylemonella gracilis]QBK05913.1 MarR family transcriptional regulator [Hylemonella gracilis]
MARAATKPTRTETVSPLEAHLGFWLRFVSNHVSARFAELLAAHGISVSEWTALRTLHDRTETRHAALIEALGMTKGAASKIVTRLEAKGLAERRLAEDSARDQVLTLTSQGRRLVPLLAALADANEAHFFGHLKAAERQALVDSMRALVAHHGLESVPVD